MRGGGGGGGKHSHTLAHTHTPTHTHRIPSIVKNNVSGRLLVIVEARRFHCADDGRIDLMGAYSDDNGASWSTPFIVVQTPGEW